MSFVRYLYHQCVPYETRYWIYKIRHREKFDKLKQTVFSSPKGDFSLRRYFDNQCVFVHITKSAGTSLALSLFGELPYHYSAVQYRVILGRKDFDQFYKFTFVRNPWDRVYSAFSYLKGGGWNGDDKIWADENLGEIDTFSEFVMDWLSVDKLGSHIHFWPQSKFICDRKGKPIIDYIGYFENIDDDFNYILKQLSLQPKTLKRTNTSKRTDYTHVYTHEMKDKIAQIYSDDIKNFGYTFESYNRTKVSNNNFIRAE